jgi:hypothetical protein
MTAPAPVTSEKRISVKLAGNRFRATVRPAHFDELVTCNALPTGNEQKERLADLCILDAEPKPTPLAKRSFGLQIQSVSGDNLEAEEVSLDDDADVPDAVAEAAVEKQEKSPNHKIVCLRLEEDHFLFLEPKPGALEAFVAKKQKGGPGTGIELDGKLVESHCFHGDLETLKRERALGVVALAQKLAQLGGLSLEAELDFR